MTSTTVYPFRSCVHQSLNQDVQLLKGVFGFPEPLLSVPPTPWFRRPSMVLRVPRPVSVRTRPVGHVQCTHKGFRTRIVSSDTYSVCTKDSGHILWDTHSVHTKDSGHVSSETYSMRTKGSGHVLSDTYSVGTKDSGHMLWDTHSVRTKDSGHVSPETYSVRTKGSGHVLSRTPMLGESRSLRTKRRRENGLGPEPPSCEGDAPTLGLKEFRDRVPGRGPSTGPSQTT